MFITFVMNTRYGLSDKTWTCGLYHPNGLLHQVFSRYHSLFRDIVLYLRFLTPFWRLSCYPSLVHAVHNHTHYAPTLCTKILCIVLNGGLRYFYLNSDAIICQVLFWKKVIFIKREGVPIRNSLGRRPHRFLQRDH